MARKRYQMIATPLRLSLEIALHPRRGDARQRPCPIEIFELIPDRTAHFALVNRGQRQDAQREPGD
ncbi:hypothetical protein O6027_04645 [Sphingomonas aerolata]